MIDLAAQDARLIWLLQRALVRLVAGKHDVMAAEVRQALVKLGAEVSL